MCQRASVPIHVAGHARKCALVVLVRNKSTNIVTIPTLCELKISKSTVYVTWGRGTARNTIRYVVGFLSIYVEAL